MSSKIIQNITVGNRHRSYLECLYALFVNCGLYDGVPYMLDGMTAMAFKSVIHRKLLASSLDVYGWDWENHRAVNTLGIYNEIYMGSVSDTTFPLYQKAAVIKIKESLDRGICAIAWGLGVSKFGLIFGYDDIDHVFYCMNPGVEEEYILLYDNFGVIQEGSWFFQTFGGRIDKDIRDIYRDSLRIAIEEWDTMYKIKEEYGAGKRAYQYLIDALKGSDWSSTGAYYILPRYLQSKQNLGLYMKEVAKEFPELTGSASLYTDIGKVCNEIAGIPFTRTKKGYLEFGSGITERLTHAKELEEKAIGEVKAWMKEELSNAAVNPFRLHEY